MSTIEKTLERVYTRIQNQEYYEAHQAVRTVVARYVRQKDHTAAIGLLYSSSLLLSKAAQTGSASDLLIYMLHEYSAASVTVDTNSRGRVAQVVWQLDPTDSALKQVAKATKNWAVKNGSPPTGDPDLNHVFGIQLARSAQPYEAEKYLLAGTKSSAEALAELHQQWYLTDPDSSHKELYISRGVLGYLTVQDIRCARAYMEKSIALWDNEEHGVTVNGVTVIENSKWMNFFQLLIDVCQTQQAVLYRNLISHYDIKQVANWEKAFTAIGEIYFGIVPPRPMNLMDLMGGMFN